MFRIYVACLASYNAGILYGKWIDVDGKTSDELREEIAALLKESPYPFAEEWAIHDHEGFDGLHVSEYHSLDELAEYAEVITSSEYEEELIHSVASDRGCNASEAVQYIEDNYEGLWDCLESWAENWLEECEGLKALPRHLQFYFNYSGYARDCELSGDIFTVSSNKGVHVLRNC